MAKVAINGLGRIGRALLKIAMDTPELELAAVNDLLPPDNLVYLLKYDSVYGKYKEQVRNENDMIYVGDKKITMFNSKDPAELPWKDLGIDIVLECTGHFTNADGLRKHISAGAKYAILSAPSKSDGMKTIIPGVNAAGPDDRMYSTASCTTNCIVPVIEVIDRRLGIEHAVLTTIHAYTSSQSIVDTPNKKVRRGRAAAINLVPTSTGAAKATAEVLPQMQDKFDGVAIRGPVPAGSISDIVCVVKKATSVDDVNSMFKEESRSEKYRDILGVSDDEIVSSDIIGDPRASIVDLTLTKVVGGKLVKVMSWYDNEWGYAAQMIRETARVARTITR